jgi:hypothetical protein
MLAQYSHTGRTYASSPLIRSFSTFDSLLIANLLIANLLTSDNFCQQFHYHIPLSSAILLLTCTNSANSFVKATENKVVRCPRRFNNCLQYVHVSFVGPCPCPCCMFEESTLFRGKEGSANGPSLPTIATPCTKIKH